MSKRAILAVTFYVFEDYPEDYEDHTIFFSAEENHCMSNHVLTEAKRIESAPGVCNFCGRANVRVIDIDGKTPSDIALSREDSDGIDYLRKHGIK